MLPANFYRRKSASTRTIISRQLWTDATPTEDGKLHQKLKKKKEKKKRKECVCVCVCVKI